jgi:N6-adenosine-specific RNA methylase IME4
MTRYRTIVADPPWAYPEGWPVSSSPTAQNARAAKRAGTVFDPRRRTPMRYEQMSVEEITALPVHDLAEDDAHLWLWTTNRYLFDAKQVAEAWGFRYSQLLVWAKTPMGKGPGGAFAQNAEFILFCRRGSLRHVEKQETVWFNWRRMDRQHSRKPDAMLDLVERVSPGPYAELFARRARFGWDYPIGDQSLGGVATCAS